MIPTYRDCPQDVKDAAASVAKAFPAGASVPLLEGAVAAAIMLDRQRREPWRPISSAPKDGSIIWAYLYQTGIRAVRFMSAEESADIDGHDDPEDYEDCWVEADDEGECWNPRWWLPFEAIPEPPK